MPTLSSKMCAIAGIAIVFLCYGCQDQKGLPREALNPDMSPSMELPGPSWEDASVDVISAEVVGDSLRVVVGYGGGCGDHRFSLMASGPAMKSLPPKQPVVVYGMAVFRQFPTPSPTAKGIWADAQHCTGIFDGEVFRL